MTKRRPALQQRAEHIERVAVALADVIQVVAPDVPNDVLIEACERARMIIGERHEAAINQAMQQQLDRAAAWRAEQGLLTAREYMARYGVSKAQFAVAVERGLLIGKPHPIGTYVHGAQLSKWDRAYQDRALTPDELQQVNGDVLLTADQSAEHLHITRAEFDKLKKKRGLEAAERRRGSSGYTYHLYRLADVETLKEAEQPYE